MGDHIDAAIRLLQNVPTDETRDPENEDDVPALALLQQLSQTQYCVAGEPARIGSGQQELVQVQEVVMGMVTQRRRTYHQPSLFRTSGRVYQEWIANRRRLVVIIAEIEEVSTHAAEATLHGGALRSHRPLRPDSTANLARLRCLFNSFSGAIAGYR